MLPKVAPSRRSSLVFHPLGAAPFGRLRLQQSFVEIDRGNMRLTTFPDLEVWFAAPPSAPLLAQLLDITPYAIAAAVVCVMLAIVVGSILATEKKRLSARPEVKSGGSWEEKVAVAHRSASTPRGWLNIHSPIPFSPSRHHAHTQTTLVCRRHLPPGHHRSPRTWSWRWTR